MKLAIITYSRQGMILADRLRKGWEDVGPGTDLQALDLCRLFTVPRLLEGTNSDLNRGQEQQQNQPLDLDQESQQDQSLNQGWEPISKPFAKTIGPLFTDMDALIFIGAAGIAVRQIAPWVQHKTKDPAVLVIDDLGHYVIPILSGHLGGANHLAQALAPLLGAQAIITTATDLHQKFAVDSWAQSQGLVIADMGLAKDISAAILEGDLPVYSDFPIAGPLPPGLYPYENPALLSSSVSPPQSSSLAPSVSPSESPSPTPPLGIAISVHTQAPFARTLFLIPPILQVGMGCRKGTPASALAAALDQVLARFSLQAKALTSLASIDLKAHEPGLLALAADLNLPFHCYSPEELLAVPGNFTASSFVQGVTGVDNVCERAAMLGADRLLVPKQVFPGITIAIAAKKVTAVWSS